MSKDNAIALLNLGIVALHDGYDSEAIGYFKSSLLLDVELVEAYLGLGLAYGRLNNYVEMVDSFRRAIKSNQPTVRDWIKSFFSDFPTWSSFSPQHDHLTAKVAAFFRRLDEADALTRLGAAHISSGLDNNAVSVLEYCLERVPDYRRAIVLLTLAYLFLESKEAATTVRLGHSSKLKKLAPELAKSLFQSGG